MKKILWISYAAPYDSVPHAGGKIENYYIKEIAKKKIYKIDLLTHCTKKESKVVFSECEDCGINPHLIIEEDIPYKNIFDIYDKFAKRNIYDKYAGFVPRRFVSSTLKQLRSLFDEGYNPDLIFVQWTQMIILCKEIQRTFPNVPIISCEEDVSFQAMQRMADYETNVFKKFVLNRRKLRLRKIELCALDHSKAVIVNNVKDKKILEDLIDTEIFRWTPYYQNFINYQREYDGNRNIVFYGSMSREENWKSAIWFIDNVMPKLKEYNVKFIIVGSNPNKELLSRKEDDVILTGFVKDVTEYLSKAMCLVAPLVLGAGVKVKIIEGMSAGIPILTNDIGIEGIPALKDTHYFHCSSPDEYACYIKRIINGEINMSKMEIDEKDNIKTNMDFSKDVTRLCNLFDGIMMNK